MSQNWEDYAGKYVEIDKEEFLAKLRTATINFSPTIILPDSWMEALTKDLKHGPFVVKGEFGELHESLQADEPTIVE